MRLISPFVLLLGLLFCLPCSAQLEFGNKVSLWFTYQLPGDTYVSNLALFPGGAFAVSNFGCFTDEKSIGFWEIKDSVLYLTTDTAAYHKIDTLLVPDMAGWTQYMIEIKEEFARYKDARSANLFRNEKFEITREGLRRVFDDGSPVMYLAN
jgi:hypothetical protein